ncbi:MAG TPA: Gfo/Idh/MocA family oxidoreductase [Candidatus Hydrogenedentes bacterium]|nr:Gfo/Idh/MocA family oxidoreductase [Candidatus Hydrogenedentota bacterium]
MRHSFSRRGFMKGAAALGAMAAAGAAEEKPIQGFEDTASNTVKGRAWAPVSDRKVRVGIVGYGVCRFGAAFGFQDHPNVEVVAVSDLFPDRCAELARACRCAKTYPSLEELVKDPAIEAVFLATDAPSHCRHAIEVLNHGKHVASAVPAVYGSLEDADRLYGAVKASGLNYMMFETSAFHDDCHAMRVIHRAGGFGELVYSEGEYFHYLDTPLDSYKDWRKGSPPLWYPTHSTAYHVCVSGGGFTEVSCYGMPSHLPYLASGDNAYKNVFGTEIALLRTTEGGMARMLMSKDTPGHNGEKGRVRGQKGSMTGMVYDGRADISSLELAKPPLPPGVEAGGHGGSHGYLCEEFVTSILQGRTPLVNIAWALNMTVAGIVAHSSALKDGELMKVPVYTL